MDSRSLLYKCSSVHRAQVVQMLFVITCDAADEPHSAPVYSTQIQDTTPDKWAVLLVLFSLFSSTQ